MVEGMGNLVKAKRIAMRDFLVETLITNFAYSADARSMVKEVMLDRAIRQNLVGQNLVADNYPLYITPLGLEYIEKWKDLQ